MKKLILLLILFFVLPCMASAAQNENFVLLDAATSTGAEGAKVVTQSYKSWGCDVVLTGSPTAVTVRVEGNQGASVYDPQGMAELALTAPQLAAGIATFEISNHRIKKIRGNLVVLTGGTAPTVAMNCVGGD